MHHWTHEKSTKGPTRGVTCAALWVCAILAGCAADQPEDSAEVNSQHWQLARAHEVDMTAAGSGATTSARPMEVASEPTIVQHLVCPLPRPPRIGCGKICKPCRVPICIRGRWVYQSIDWEERLCRPSLPEDRPCCTSGPHGFCPAECGCCSP